MESVNFEGIEQKLQSALDSAPYHVLINKIIRAKKIFLIGNGGLHFVANHAATDCSRLIKGKVFYSFESVGFITSNANDHGYDSLFIRWMETVAFGVENPDETLIIGMSCSGNSVNVIDALSWAKDNHFDTFMISGVKSKKLNPAIHELIYDCTYFHTVEVLALMTFYDLIHKTGNHCPTIGAENTRKGNDVSTVPYSDNY